jgi:hypothetical protein
MRELKVCLSRELLIPVGFSSLDIPEDTVHRQYLGCPYAARNQIENPSDALTEYEDHARY